MKWIGWAGVLVGVLAPAIQAQTDTLDAPVVTRIGGDDVPFGRVEAVEVDAAGRVYVLDGLEHRLVAFAPDGTEVWRLGREGRGPGEFAFPVGLAWHPSGELWVVDPENQRVTRVTRDGELAGTGTLPSGFALSPWPGRFDRQGRFWSYLAGEGTGFDYVMAAYDAEMRRVVVLEPPSPPEPEAFFEGRTERGSPMRARVPFTPRLIWHLASDGSFIWNWTASPVFHGAAGPVGTLSGAESPRVSEDERAAAIEGLTRFRERGGRVDPRRIPDRKPPIRTFLLDADDRIWAMRSREAGKGGSCFDILEPGVSGPPRARVLLPADLATVPTPVVRDAWLVGVERGSFGTDTVVLLRVGGA